MNSIYQLMEKEKVFKFFKYSCMILTSVAPAQIFTHLFVMSIRQRLMNGKEAKYHILQ